MRLVYVFVLASLGLTMAQTQNQHCFLDVHNMCVGANEAISCTSQYSGVHHVMSDLHAYVMQHFEHSFQYLLISASFANYEKNREGFAKLFRKYSDSTWEDAIEIIKYIGKRGDVMKFDALPPKESNEINYDMFELESLSKALDMHKNLAEKSHEIHSFVTKRSGSYHDAETLSFIEEKFVHKHADRIRELAGHANDLSSIVKRNEDPSLSIFLFDEYLQKVSIA